MSLLQTQRTNYEGWRVNDRYEVCLSEYELGDYLTPLADSVADLLEQTQPGSHGRKQMLKNLGIIVGGEYAFNAKEDTATTGKSFARAMDFKMRKPSNSYFYGSVDTVEKADTLLNEGWQEGAKRIESFAQELNVDAEISAAFENLPSARRKLTWQDKGEEIDMGRVYCGQLETAWRGSKRRAGGVRAISLIMQQGGNGSCNDEALFWNGAAGVVLAQLLEENGYAVELICVDATRYCRKALVDQKTGKQSPDTDQAHSQHYTVQMVRCKRREDPMSLDAIAGVACLAGVFRSHGFAKDVLSNNPGTWVTPIGLGRNVDFRDADLSQWPLDGEPIAIGQAFSRADAITAVKNVLDQVTQQADSAA